MEGLSLVLVCKIGILPTTYFGFPFGNSLQINGGGEILEKACFMEETMPF